eukprot:s810_g16.t1
MGKTPPRAALTPPLRCRLVRKTPPRAAYEQPPGPSLPLPQRSESSQQKLRGQCRVQGLSKFHAQVAGLVGKDRRKKLAPLYEKNRKRPEGYKRPSSGKKPNQKESNGGQPKDSIHCPEASQLVMGQSDAVTVAVIPQTAPDDCSADQSMDVPEARLLPPVLPSDSEAEFAEPSANLAMVDAKQEEKRCAQEEIAVLRKELAQCKQQLQWHENVRDWVAACGAECAVHMARYGQAVEWAKFQGEMVCL